MKLKNVFDNEDGTHWGKKATFWTTAAAMLTVLAITWTPLVDLSNLATQEDVAEVRAEASASDSALMDKMAERFEELNAKADSNEATNDYIKRMIQCIYRKPSNVTGVEFCGDVE